MVGATRPRPRIALVSREVAPFGGGGIGRYVTALAGVLAGEFEVTVFTTSRHRKAHRRARERDPGSLPAARIVFVDEPRSWDARSSYNVLHAWSARAHEAILAEYGGAGPELIEFPDFLGEGCVTVQAKRTASPALASTAVCVRAHGTAEMYDVLDGFLPSERERSFTFELERYALRFCDGLLWAGGDILGTYERFYGESALAEPRLVRHPFAWEAPGAGGARPDREGPLSLLYLGRLERRKGVRALVDALLGLERREWRLTMVGGDTDTAPLGTSMRALLETEIAGDERIRLLSAVPRAEVPALIDAHDALVVPSLWECWPYVVLEALERGRPVLATRTGGLAELVVDGETGWLADDGSSASLARALAPIVEEPELARDGEWQAAGRERFGKLTDATEIRARYHELSAPPPPPPTRRTSQNPRHSANSGTFGGKPLVSIVVPYFEMEAYVREAVASAASQTHGRVEIVIVNDGSFRAADEVLLELEERYGARVVAQPNSGLGAARNLGIAVSHGEYVLPLDADNQLAPEFVERCLAALESDSEIAYVSSWLRYIDADGAPWKGTEEGLWPIGNSSRAVDELNVGGDAVAVFRRSVFEAGLRYSEDLAGFEDWTLYREMRRRGLTGHIVPEPLISYRLRDDSMMRTLSESREEWIRQAIEAHLAERALDWSAPRR